MARRGPPPQPTTLKLLRGNPGKRSISSREPRPPVTCPWCPRWLSPEAKRIWKETVPVLKAMTFRIQARELGTSKLMAVITVRDEKGNVRCMQQFPQVAIARSLLQVVQSYQQEFGMTPSARTRVHEIPGLVRDPEEERFFGPH